MEVGWSTFVGYFARFFCCRRGRTEGFRPILDLGWLFCLSGRSILFSPASPLSHGSDGL
jgi:hypothetical protein